MGKLVSTCPPRLWLAVSLVGHLYTQGTADGDGLADVNADMSKELMRIVKKVRRERMIGEGGGNGVGLEE
jgi:hypothetical protein